MEKIAQGPPRGTKALTGVALTTEKKKPGRKKKPVKPVTVTHSETPIVLEFK